jgi:CHAT domain-containing protein
MNQTINEEEAIKQYLLGRLSEEEQTPLEERLLTDDDFFERLSLAENELIDEYLADRLGAEDLERFNSHFMTAPERQNKLGFSMTLRKYVTRETTTQTDSGAGSTEGAGRARRAESSDAGRRNGATNGGSKLKTDGSRIEVEPAGTGPRAVSGPWARIASNSYLRMAASLIIVLGVVLGVYLAFFRQSDVNKGLAALRDAYRSQRPVEARITALSYAHFPQTRGGEQANFDEVKHDRAQRIILDAVDEHPGPDSEHALGVFLLTEKQFDKAIPHLEVAVKATPKDPQYHCDLGAAWLEKGKADKVATESDRNQESFGRILENLAKALEHLNRAIELNPSLLEALFNRGLCHQEMMLRHQAEEDWKEYLGRDASSNWANEARRNLESLELQEKNTSQTKEDLFDVFLGRYQSRDDASAWKLLSLSRARNRNLITERLLDDYLAFVGEGQEDKAKTRLAMLSYVGELETRTVGDRFTRDLVRFYTNVRVDHLADLARAHGLMRSGYQRYDESEFEQAIDSCAQARRLFRDSGDACEALFAENWVGNCYLRIPDIEHALSIFEYLYRISKDRSYRWLVGQSLNGLTDAETSVREFSRALDYANQKLELSAQIQDPNGILMTLQQPVNMYLQFGDYVKSLGFGLQALDLASGLSPGPKVVWTFYHQMAFDLYSLGYALPALDFEAEALRLAIESRWPLIKSRSYARLGLIYAGLKDYVSAIKNGQAALEESHGIQGELSKLNIVSYSTLNLANLCRQSGDQRAAIGYYDRAVELYGKLNNLQIYLYEAHMGKLLSLLSLKQDDLAREELKTTLGIYEEYRPKILEESNRDSFFDVGQTVYDLAVDFEYSRMHDHEKAFQYAEACRARSLLDLANSRARVEEGEDGPEIRLSSVEIPLKTAEIQRRIPDEAQVVEYAALDDKLVIWVISRTGFSSAVQQVSLAELSGRVTSFVNLVSNAARNREACRASEDIYELLIGPAEQYLDKSKMLCIVPDKILNYVPFCSLVSPRTGKYFGETYASMVAPSSNMFIFCSDIAEKRTPVSDERIFAVGDPSLDPDEFPLLRRLPSAGREAKGIGAYYQSSVTLVADQATRRKVLKGLETSEVVHMATHCVIDERSHLLSKIALAKDGSGAKSDVWHSGSLQASDLYGMKLPRSRLVVLSACQTGIERSYRGEGAISFARPFIAAGVPMVVASLWPVDSGSTTEFMINFHKHRKQDGVPTVEALRRTQMDMLHSQDARLREAYVWAPFVVVGGYAKF